MFNRFILTILIVFQFAFNVRAGGNIDIWRTPRWCDTVEIYKIGPGVTYHRLNFPDIPLKAYLAIVDLNNKNLAIESFIAQDQVIGYEQTSSACKRNTYDMHDVFLGINGSFSEVTSTDPDFLGYPVAGNMDNGIIRTNCGKMDNNEWLASIGIDKNKVPYIDRMQMKGIVKCSKETKEANFVQTNRRRGDNEMSFYNEFAGEKTFSGDNGTEVYFKPIDGKWNTNKPMLCTVEQIIKGKGGNPTIKNMGILSGSGQYKTFLEQLSVGDKIEVTMQIAMDIDKYKNIYPEFTTMISGNRCIMRDGAVTWDATADLSCAAKDPRTITGYSADQKTFYVLVLDGRQVGSAGMSCADACAILYHYGARWAINNDSGGSSTFVLNRKVMNVPSDGPERAIGDGLMFVNTAPEDNNIAMMETDKPKIVLPRYARYKPNILAYNQYDKLLDPDFKDAVLSCPSSLGYIAQDGSVVVSGTKNGQITVTYGNITTLIDVELISAPMKIRLDSVIVDRRKDYEIEVQSEVNGNIFTLAPDVLTWTVSDPSVCSVTNGIIKFINNGRTTITGQLDNFTDELIVNVETPESGRIIHDDFAETANWKITATGGTSKGEFNTSNRPENWTHGSVYNYTISGSVRAPSIKLTPIISNPFYGLPDTIRITLNSGKAVISKATLSFKSNNSKTAQLNVSIDNIEPDKDCTLIIPVAEIVDNPCDRMNYPFRLNYISLQLAASSQIQGESYAIALKDISLAYKGIETGGISSPLISRLTIYPNPAYSHENIYINMNEPGTLSVYIYNLSGEMISFKDYGMLQAGEVLLSQLSGQPSGTYIIKAEINGIMQTAKLILH